MALFALLAGCSTAPSTTPVTDETTTTDQVATEGTTFPFEDLNFTLTFPADWVAANVTNEEKDTTWAFGTTKTLYFKTDESDLFAVTMFTKDQWTAIEAEDSPKPTVIAEKNGFVWAYDQTQDGSGVQNLLDELPQVLASFQVNK